MKSIQGFQCIYNELERKGSLPYLENKHRLPPPPLPERTKAIVHPIPDSSSLLRSQTLLRSRSNLQVFQPTKVEVEEWIQKEAQRDSKSLVFHLTIFPFPKDIPSFFFQFRSIEHLQQNQLPFFFRLIIMVRSFDDFCSSIHFVLLGNRRSYTRKSNSIRPFSSYGGKRWEHSNDLTPGLTKSAFIYQLIRTRLEANLARSRSFHTKENIL